jgi:DnaJ-class molecular chaperone
MEVAQSCHPSKNPNQAAVNQAKFDEVCEAYDVLSQSKCPSLSLQINSAPESHL